MSYAASGVYMVTSTADTLVVGTLRSAIAWSNLSPSSTPTGNTIIFDTNGVFATPQTITLSPSMGALGLTNTGSPLSIDGPGSTELTISGGGAVGVFTIAPGVTVAIGGVTIAEGAASASGGAILNQGNLTISSDVFSNDSAILYGGAIYNSGGKLTITNSTFSGDSATNGLGGAIDNSGTLSVDGSTFSGGAAYQGGAIDNKAGGVLFISYSTFDNNSGTLGGAIFNDAYASIYGSTIANDDTNFDGGGIANDLAGTMFIVDSTIANNNAAQSGGGINTVGTLTVINSTIAYNSVNSGGAGGGIYATTGTATLDNTIVALNTSGTGTTASANDISGSVSSASAFNLIGVGGSGSLTTSTTTGNQVGVTSPGLGVLANNGGPTQTIALLAGSPAIDAGSNALAVDALRKSAGVRSAGTGLCTNRQLGRRHWGVRAVLEHHDGGQVITKSLDLWSNGRIHCHRFTLSFQYPDTHRHRHVLGRNFGAANRAACRRRSVLHNRFVADRRQHHQRCLQRRWHLRHQHLNPDLANRQRAHGHRDQRLDRPHKPGRHPIQLGYHTDADRRCQRQFREQLVADHSCDWPSRQGCEEGRAHEKSSTQWRSFSEVPPVHEDRELEAIGGGHHQACCEAQRQAGEAQRQAPEDQRQEKMNALSAEHQ